MAYKQKDKKTHGSFTYLFRSRFIELPEDLVKKMGITDGDELIVLFGKVDSSKTLIEE
ncbi:MAG: hypothetical protein IH840_09095 [Candidatus Heimdallarchaeota archaeon]|nr:hypothetical protein [Candidatus Heimdallarchaeota archaeon]